MTLWIWRSTNLSVQVNFSKGEHIVEFHFGIIAESIADLSSSIISKGLTICIDQKNLKRDCLNKGHWIE